VRDCSRKNRVRVGCKADVLWHSFCAVEMLKGVQYPKQGNTQNVRHRRIPVQNRSELAGMFQNPTVIPNNDQCISKQSESDTDITGLFKGISGFDGNSGRVQIDLNSFGKLMDKALYTENRLHSSENPPLQAVFENVEIFANAFAEYVKFRATFTVVILNPTWTQTPILSSNCALESIHIEHISESKSANTLHPSCLDENAEDIETSNEDDQVSAYVGVDGDFYSLISYGSASWRVTVEAFSQFVSVQKRMFAMWIPLSLCSTVLYGVSSSKGSQIKVDSALEQNLVAVEQEQNKNQFETDFEYVKARLPPTNHVTVSWLESAVGVQSRDGIDQGQSADGAVAQLDVSVTASQLVMASIGEGVVNYQMDWSVSVLHGVRFCFEVVIPNTLVVRTVVGKNIKKWEICKALLNQAPALTLAIKANTVQERVLKVWHQLGVEGDYSFSVIGEAVIGANDGMHQSGQLLSSSGTVEMTGTKMINVERQKGFVAIEARTNVEVTEGVVESVNRVDSNELPDALLNLAQSAVLCCYKFLGADWKLSFDVKRHQDVEVLVAVIDEAWMTSTVVSEGKMQTRLELKMRNTTKQYVRLKLPENTRIWSTEVHGALVKPAYDAEQSTVMIALEKSSGESQGKETFWVDLVYITESLPKMKGNGTLQLKLPKLDLPVNHFFIEFYLPKNFKYAEFTGDLKELKKPYFSAQKSRIDDSDAFLYENPRGFRARADPVDLGGFQEQELVAEKSKEMRPSYSMAGSAVQKSRKTAGVKPVRVSMIMEGTRFLFERLLVENEMFEIEVEYEEVYESRWSKRKLGLFKSR